MTSPLIKVNGVDSKSIVENKKQLFAPSPTSPTEIMTMDLQESITNGSLEDDSKLQIYGIYPYGVMVPSKKTN